MLKVFVRDKRVVVLVFVVAVVIVCFRFGCVKVQEACMGGARCQGKRGDLLGRLVGGSRRFPLKIPRRHE